LDTRKKIIEGKAAEALIRKLRSDGTKIRAVTGYFDVLLAPNVHDMTAGRDGSKLFVFVMTPTEPVLALGARAELAASLSAVDYVVTAEPGNTPDALHLFGPSEVTDFRPAEKDRMVELVRHVHGRHAG
jgi:bifunctional ADP-heptose synthase (sugar kinase/adenylyltransferase)